MTRNALLSVTDKRGIVEFGKGLVARGFRLLSTGGTACALREAGVPVTEVADFTGFPEILGGRVKTLHPRVHGGLLARRDNLEDRAQMDENGLEPIDVVAVNLYRFREAAARPGASPEDVIEQIDIGGPAMIRSAAKNHAAVAVVVDPDDYGRVLEELGDDGRSLSKEFARALAGKAYAHTASYDAAVASWFETQVERPAGQGALPGRLSIQADKARDLRYGENPHQHAALYLDAAASGKTLAHARQIGGKELSYNNLLDLDAAFALCQEFDAPAAVVIKHATPCGVAVADEPVAALRAAWQADALSAFGGILAVNRALDAAMAEVLIELGTFVEAIVAPSIAPAAVEVLAQAKWGQNVRLLDLGGWPEVPAADASSAAPIPRAISGGWLAQTPDVRRPEPELTWPTKTRPDGQHERALAFAWAVCKHVRSNAIVLVHAPDDNVFATCGIGGGQTSRVDSVKIAVEKAGDRARGAVLASDAFFPFADGLEAAARAGVVAAIQPGGSRRDEEVIAAADAAGVAMAFTGIRHFRH
jgi:phosphoribosylaminoimidazolecarboxamide formyltransferase/IMP cyclohydrolase